MSNWNGKTIGNVQIGEFIARGGMAEVYLGEHKSLNRKVALKIMRDHVVKFASINYHREVPMGQQVEVFYTPSDDGWYFIAKHADKTAFECYLELEPVKQ